jgi:MFS family permease
VTVIEVIWKVQSARRLLLPYLLFSFAVSALDEAFPLFCIAAKSAGLAVSENSIGEILSISGLLFASFQYLVYVNTVQKVGLYKSLWLGCALGFLPVFFIPVSRIIDDTNNKNSSQQNPNDSKDLKWSAVLFLVSIMAVSKIFCCMFFTSMSIALNKTVERNQRATLNGLASLGGSISKGLGPILAGLLVGMCFSWPKIADSGSFIVFTIIGAAGLAVLAFLPGLEQQ